MQIVTRQSASLGNHIASPMIDVDHNNICKFNSTFGGFRLVADKLRYIRGILMGQEAGAGAVFRDSNVE